MIEHRTRSWYFLSAGVIVLWGLAELVGAAFVAGAIILMAALIPLGLLFNWLYRTRSERFWQICGLFVVPVVVLWIFR